MMDKTRIYIIDKSYEEGRGWRGYSAIRNATRNMYEHFAVYQNMFNLDIQYAVREEQSLCDLDDWITYKRLSTHNSITKLANRLPIVVSLINEHFFRKLISKILKTAFKLEFFKKQPVAIPGHYSKYKIGEIYIWPKKN